MDWGSLGKKIADMGAQVLGEALPFPGAGVAADALSAALGCEKDPDAISEAIAKDPEAAAKIKEVELNHKAQLKEIAADHKEEMRKYQAQDTQGARSFAATELQSDDKYVRRTRPEMVRFTVKGGIAYIFLSTAALCLLSVLDVVSEAEADLLFEFLKYQSGFVVGMIYMVFRTYTTRRSQDKAMEKMGALPEGLMDKAAKLIGGRKVKE